MRWLVTIVIVMGTTLPQLSAAVAGPVIRELAEQIVRRTGQEVTETGLETAARQVEKAVAQHGEQAVPVIRAGGSSAIRALDTAADQSPAVVRLFARFGDEALPIFDRPETLRLFLKHGDDAAEAMIRHPGLAANLIGRHGGDLAPALKSLSKGGGQQFGMFLKQGGLDNQATRQGLLDVIGRHGDRAMNFIWRNKGALAVTAAATAFIADPEAFLNGTKELTKGIGEVAAATIPWPFLVLGAVVLMVLAIGPWMLRRSRALAKAAKTPQNGD